MRPSRPTFLYDADCGACTRFKRLASFFDPARSIDFVSIAAAGRNGLLESVPSSHWFDCSRMISPDGSMTCGGDALVSLLSRLPGGGFPSLAFRAIPFGLNSARRFYSIVSRLHGASCASPSLTRWSFL